MRTTGSLVPALLALALVGTACSDGGDPALDRIADLESELAARDTAQGDLRQRVDDLEARLAEPEGDDPLASLRTQVAELGDTVAALDERVSTSSSQRDGEIEGLASDIAALDGRLADLQGSLTSLTERVDLLTDELNSLEAQFEAHRTHP